MWDSQSSEDSSGRQSVSLVKMLNFRRLSRSHSTAASKWRHVSPSDRQTPYGISRSASFNPQSNRIKPKEQENKSVVSVGCSSSSTVVREMHAIKKGLLWQQRERLFSRWKERYFILTKDYLHCFKRSTGGLSPMGQFIFKVKLVEVERVEWINKKSYSMIGLSLQATDSRILLRAEIGLQDWFELLEECMIASKERRRALRKLHDPLWDQDSASLKFPDWISQRGNDLADNDSFSDSVSDIQKVRSRSGRDSDFWHRPYAENRLSLLTDIDLNSCASSTPAETPPPSSYRGKPCRLNSDIFFRAPGDVVRYQKSSGTPTPALVYCGGGGGGRSALTPVGSFRGPHYFNPPPNVQVKYRDRSQSDAYGSNKGRRHMESQDSRRSSHIFPIALV